MRLNLDFQQRINIGADEMKEMEGGTRTTRIA